jgi:hypothetical protein
LAQLRRPFLQCSRGGSGSIDSRFAETPWASSGDIREHSPRPTSCRIVGCHGYVKPPRSSKSAPNLIATPQTLASGSRKLKPYPSPTVRAPNPARRHRQTREAAGGRERLPPRPHSGSSARSRESPGHQRRIAARTSSRRKARERRRLCTETHAGAPGGMTPGRSRRVRRRARGARRRRAAKTPRRTPACRSSKACRPGVEALGKLHPGFAATAS